MTEWISVHDRLPKIGESVLVCVLINAKLNLPSDITPEIRIGWRDSLSSSHRWCLQFSNADYSEITHWQPLPKLPQANKKVDKQEAYRQYMHFCDDCPKAYDNTCSGSDSLQCEREKDALLQATIRSKHD